MSFAQSKGDSYVSATIGLEFGSQKTTTTIGSLSVSESQPLATSFSLGAEYGYFVSNNLRLGFAIQVPYTCTPTTKDNDEWLKTKTVGIGFNPNVSYYFQIKDNFYYTPEIGCYYELGNYKESLTSNTSYDNNYTGWSVYLNLLSFEFKVSKDFAIGVNLGTLQYITSKIKDKDTDTEINVSRFNCAFNKAGAHARFYF